MEFLFIAFAPILLAILITLAGQRLQSQQQGWLLASGMAVCFFLALASGFDETIILRYPWMPQAGLEFSFYVDGLARLFVLVITGIGTAIMLYAGYYFDDAQESARFLGLLLTFTTSMLLLVMAGNLITLFIAWELTSIISFLLIGFKGKYAEARSGASQALVITGTGGLALLAGLLVMGTAAGTFDMATLLSSGDLLRDHPWYTGFAILIMIGCFSKSAQFPLHFWLPGAMSAPTPASAFLHSATMVKAGVYLLARFYPVLGDTALWGAALVGFGLVTLFVGGLLSLFQRDLKGILAYTTISQLGALVAMIGLPESQGLKAAMIGILAHALYKGTLFLVAGAIDHATGTRDINKLANLRRLMPGFAVITAIVGLSMAGAPPLFGFVAKETFLEAFIEQPLALVLIVSSAIFMVAVALRLFWDVFMRAEAPEPDPHADHYHALPPMLMAGPAALALASIVFGLGIGPLIGPVVSGALGKTTNLYLFPSEVNTAFILSMLALAIGVGLFLARGVWLRLPFTTIISGRQGYLFVVGLVESFGDLLLRSQGGKIRYYLVVIFMAVFLLLSTVILSPTTIAILQNLVLEFRGVADLLKIILLVLALLATLASILFERHLVAALALGGAGYAVGGLFLLEPAPDVALVQFLVETLVSVLIIVILSRTSEHERQKAMQRIWSQTPTGIQRDALIAIAMGGMVAIFALAAVSTRPRPETVAQWHLENALPQVGVTDVVAGIITDFRAMDTMVEIMVFGMAALGVLSILAKPRNPAASASGMTGMFPQLVLPGDRPVLPTDIPAIVESRLTEEDEKSAIEIDAEQPERFVYEARFSDPITRWVSNIIAPLALMIALAHLLFAGSMPGDGFTAGVIGGLAITLNYIVFGYTETKQRLRLINPPFLIGLGMTIAIVNAFLPMIFGRDLMAFTSISGFDFANVKLASSLVFEVGIFLTVGGGIGTIMEAISRPKEVEPL